MSLRSVLIKLSFFKNKAFFDEGVSSLYDEIVRSVAECNDSNLNETLEVLRVKLEKEIELCSNHNDKKYLMNLLTALEPDVKVEIDDLTKGRMMELENDMLEMNRTIDSLKESIERLESKRSGVAREIMDQIRLWMNANYTWIINQSNVVEEVEILSLRGDCAVVRKLRSQKLFAVSVWELETDKGKKLGEIWGSFSEEIKKWRM